MPGKGTLVKTTPATLRLARRRQDLETCPGDLRLALDREIGWAPTGKTWVLPLAAFACGVAIATWLVARRSRPSKASDD